MDKTSQIQGFYRLTVDERLRLVKEYANLTDAEVATLRNTGALPIELADRMIENVVGAFQIPLGIAVNFLINSRDYLIPMAIEEPSVVAAASNAAKMTRSGGGIHASSTPPVMISQIQTVNLKNPEQARKAILEAKTEILEKANQQDPFLLSIGGGAKDLEVRTLHAKSETMLITELYVDCRDVMGANVVNTMAEAVAPLIERLTGGQVLLRIVTNLATKRLARAWTTVPKEAVGGEEVVDGIVKAYEFAAADPHRAATHNKGILNGTIAVVLATCNDHRAVEAGAHAYAARNGRYAPLSTWSKNEKGDLVGSLEMPIAVGITGGATRTHPIAQISLKILGVKTANELAEVAAAVGLAQNLAALRALASEGIQRGHMRLHARNIAIMAGATSTLIDLIADKMVAESKIRVDRAKELLEKYKQTGKLE